MRLRALSFLLLLAAAACASVPDPVKYTVLPAGRYAVAVRGMISTVCARAIVAEWEKLPQVEKASMNYDRETGIVVVRLGQTLKVSALRRGMRRAEGVANLGGRYELRDVQYVP